MESNNSMKKRTYTNWKKKFQTSTEEISTLKKEKESLLLKIKGKEDQLTELFDTQLSNNKNPDERKTKNIFEIIIGSGSLLVAIVVGIYIYKQTDIMDEQSGIYRQQTNLLKNQEKLIKEQNNLFLQQNSMFDLQNNLIGNQNAKFDLQNQLFQLQNDLVEIQNDKTEQQNQLVSSQNKLFKNQNKRIDQQTNLQEADRRSSLVYLFSNVLDKIDDELKTKDNITRKLTPELIARIASLTQALKPYKYLKNDEIITEEVSPERGQLLSALLNFQLDSLSYIEIFKKSNFQNTELFNAPLENVTLNGIDLSNSKINSNFSNSTFINAKLDNAVLNGSNMDNVIFRETNLFNTKFVDVNAPNTTFKNCIIHATDFSGANMTGANFETGFKFTLDLGKVIDGNFNNKTVDNFKIEINYKDFNLIVGTEGSYDQNNDKGQKIATLYHMAIATPINKWVKVDEKTTKMIGSIALGSQNMIKVIFRKTNLTEASFVGFNFLNSEFSEANLTKVIFTNCLVNKTYFNSAIISKEAYDNNFKNKSIELKMKQPLPFSLENYYELEEKEMFSAKDFYHTSFPASKALYLKRKKEY
jgi:uncharacterized protein YjbI with pentapeptide repeats